MKYTETLIWNYLILNVILVEDNEVHGVIQACSELNQNNEGKMYNFNCSATKCTRNGLLKNGWLFLWN